MKPTLNRLRELFSYDPVSGDVIRLITRNPRNAKAGDIVGSLDSGGYLQVRVDGVFVRVHRVAFALHHGWLPDEVDHVDHDRENNRIRNLRPATRVQNNGNRSMNRNNTSGFKGVTRNAKRNSWRAQITRVGKVIYLGSFSSPEKAYECYCEAAKKHFGEEYAAL